MISPSNLPTPEYVYKLLSYMYRKWRNVYMTTTTHIDYRDLLKRYMDMVGVCEGTTFISSAKEMGTFSDEEIEELRRIDDSIEDEYKIWKARQ